MTDTTIPRPLSRRQLLQLGAVSIPALGGLDQLVAAPRKRPRVAAIYTICTHRSHAHVILENFLEPYLFNGSRPIPASTSSPSTPTSDPSPVT